MGHFYKRVKLKRLTIREAVAKWGDDWAIFAPREFARQKTDADITRHAEALTMICCEKGAIPRIRALDIEDGERLMREERCGLSDVGWFAEKLAEERTLYGSEE